MSIRWVEWGTDAFSRAQASGQPLLLSLTATWCHACHRMDDETWDDPAVAAAVERATVPVRVDADARPDVYGRYHLGGLPSTALLTADGEFVRGATFLSGPQFFAFLEAALGDFRAGRRPPRPPRSSSTGGRGSTDRGSVNSRAPGERVRQVVARLVRRADLEYGGFGSAPKLAEVEALTLLLRRWRTTRDVGLERILHVTLDAIVEHLQDPRDGGFFRYAAAADWSGPHTEKVAVDQARITLMLFEAGCALGVRRYIESGRRCLAHARRRLADQEGRVLASIAADPEGHVPASIAADPEGRGRAGIAADPEDQIETEGAQAKCAAAATSAADDTPSVDRRRFADSSAAMVLAAWFSLAVTGEPPGVQAEFRSAAGDGAIPHRLDELHGERERHRRPDGVVGLLRDQAFGIEATLMEYRMTGDPALLDWAQRTAEWSVRHLWDDETGAFRMAPAGADGTLGLPPVFPLLANGEMALALIGLAAHAKGRAGAAGREAGVRVSRPPAEGSGLHSERSGAHRVSRGSRQDWRRYAERAVETLGARALVSPAGPSVALAAQLLESEPVEADISGDPADRRAQDLARAVVAAIGAATVVRWRGGVEATITLCVGDTCLPPLRDPRDLLHSLVDSGLAHGGILDFRL